MKAIIAILFLFPIIRSFAQNENYSSQLFKIIAAAKNDFKEIRGELRKDSLYADSIWYSTISLEGTSRNMITRGYTDSIHHISFSFDCLLDSSSVKEAKKTVAHYKQMTEEVLDKFYKVETYSHGWGSRLGETKGFIFIGSTATIAILYTTLPRSNVSLSFISVHKK